MFISTAQPTRAYNPKWHMLQLSKAAFVAFSCLRMLIRTTPLIKSYKPYRHLLQLSEVAIAAVSCLIILTSTAHTTQVCNPNWYRPHLSAHPTRISICCNNPKWHVLLFHARLYSSAQHIRPEQQSELASAATGQSGMCCCFMLNDAP